MVSFIKDNAMTKSEGATKEDLLKMATKEDLKEAIAESEARMETRLVTKAYLDDKLADLTSELGDRIYRHDNKERTFKSELILYLDENRAIKPEQTKRLKELV